MTDREWWECSDPRKMLWSFPSDWKSPEEAHTRKLLLFGIACCRRIWHLLTDQASQDAVEMAQRRANGKAPQAELLAVSAPAGRAWHAWGSNWSPSRSAASAACHLTTAQFALVSHEAARAVRIEARQAGLDAETAWNAERMAHCDLLRDLIRRPTPLVSLHRSWLTPSVTAIAQVIYTEERFEDLPILADALEDAGCDNIDVLVHCRGKGLHTRGCWVLDRLLGEGGAGTLWTGTPQGEQLSEQQ